MRGSSPRMTLYISGVAMALDVMAGLVPAIHVLLAV
jgi:hypothetical protein